MSEIVLLGGDGTAEGSLDERLGIIALRQGVWVPTWLAGMRMAPPLIDDVTLLPCLRRTFRRKPSGEVGGWEFFFDYEGHLNPESATGEEFELEGSLDQEPVEKHWDINRIQKKYGGTVRDDGRIVWPLEISASKFGGQGEGTVRNPIAGVSEYWAPGLVWVRRWVTSVLNKEALVRALGKIDFPPGNPPVLTGGRNWIKIRVRAAWRGNIWQIEESWLLSDEGGWLEDIYRYR